MKYKRLLPLLCLLMAAGSLAAQIYEPVRWDFSIDRTSDTTAVVTVNAAIDNGWHLYATSLPAGGPQPTTIAFDKVENATLVGTLVSDNRVVTEYDPNFEINLSWYVGQARFRQRLRCKSGSEVRVSGNVNFMACNDESCLPPADVPFNLRLKGVKPALAESQEVQPAEPADTVADAPAAAPAAWEPVESLSGNAGDASNNGSLWWVFLMGLLGGLVALVTPCVWPVIPMTVSFFLRRAENPRRGRRDALLYGLSIVLIYVVFSLIITIPFGADTLNRISTGAVFNLVCFALLVLFALSFFGLFELQLPASWSTRLDRRADSSNGVVSILFMALTLVIVSFSCTGPIVGTLLVDAATKGSLLAPVVGMLGFSIALAVPFSLFAFFPTALKKLPRSGGWMNTVKVVLAFVELAFSLKFLSVADMAYGWHLLPRETFLALWIAMALALAAYLFGWIRLPHDEVKERIGVGRFMLGLISLAFALYMLPGLWGAPLKAVSAFAPPMSTQDFRLDRQELTPMDDYDRALSLAARQGKPVVIDFSGYGCVNCRKMETKVWSDPEVRDWLNRECVFVSLYVDDRTELPEPMTVTENGRTLSLTTVGQKWSYLQRHKFGTNAQPYYVMIDSEGRPLRPAYKFDDNARHFMQWLQGQ